jgi:hypothetical protein
MVVIGVFKRRTIRGQVEALALFRIGNAMQQKECVKPEVSLSRSSSTLSVPLLVVLGGQRYAIDSMIIDTGN